MPLLLSCPRRLYGRIARLGEMRIMKRADTGEDEAVQLCDVRLNMSEQLISVPRSDFDILDDNVSGLLCWRARLISCLRLCCVRFPGLCCSLPA